MRIFLSDVYVWVKHLGHAYYSLYIFIVIIMEKAWWGMDWDCENRPKSAQMQSLNPVLLL